MVLLFWRLVKLYKKISDDDENIILIICQNIFIAIFWLIVFGPVNFLPFTLMLHFIIYSFYWTLCRNGQRPRLKIKRRMQSTILSHCLKRLWTVRFGRKYNLVQKNESSSNRIRRLRPGGGHRDRRQLPFVHQRVSGSSCLQCGKNIFWSSKVLVTFIWHFQITFLEVACNSVKKCWSSKVGISN